MRSHLVELENMQSCWLSITKVTSCKPILLERIHASTGRIHGEIFSHNEIKTFKSTMCMLEYCINHSCFMEFWCVQWNIMQSKHYVAISESTGWASGVGNSVNGNLFEWYRLVSRFDQVAGMTPKNGFTKKLVSWFTQCKSNWICISCGSWQSRVQHSCKLKPSNVFFGDGI